MSLRLDRRAIVLAAAGFALPTQSFAAVPDEATIGSARARVHLIEYASTTCGHCARFHHDNWTTLKGNYIDTGRVRFSLREMATEPAVIALALFQLARCGAAAPEEYFRRVAVLFERQGAIFESNSMAGVRDAMFAIGAEWGLTQAQILACVQDPAGADRINRSIAEAAQRGIDGTPTFLINGTRVTDLEFQTPAGMARILDARLG